MDYNIKHIPLMGVRRVDFPKNCIDPHGDPVASARFQNAGLVAPEKVGRAAPRERVWGAPLLSKQRMTPILVGIPKQRTGQKRCAHLEVVDAIGGR